MGLFAVPAVLYITADSAGQADYVAAQVQASVREQYDIYGGKHNVQMFLDEELPTTEVQQGDGEDLPGSIMQTHVGDVTNRVSDQLGKTYRDVEGDLPESIVDRVIGSADR